MYRKLRVDKYASIRPLATFIIQKWVDLTKIVWAKEMILAARLIKKYPEESFWRGLDSKGRVPSLALFWGEKAKKTLGWKYEEYKRRKNVDSKIIIPDNTITIELLSEKTGEDRTFPKKVKNVIEFCK